MAADNVAPKRLTLRAYNVGFGDCFLLTFDYGGSTGNRHVLIDFGSTGKAEGASQTLLLDIANDIKEQCQGKLHAIVATHRHKDHISGFTTNAKNNGPGDVIASLDPDVVVQPWTEDPKAKPDAKEATRLSSGKTDGKSLAGAFVGSLNDMHSVAAFALAEALNPNAGLGVTAAAQIAFLGDDNLSNRSAVENLMKMGRKHYYVNFGSRSGLETLLPGVNIQVLGPPTLKQSAAISKESSRNKDEFWMVKAFWGFQAQAMARTDSKQHLFPNAKLFLPSEIPPRARWFVKHAQSIRAEQMVGLVRALDSAMNNTSIILLFESGGKRLLFPGDAQFENWSYALRQKDIQAALKKVNLYKVGHHGSLNATPKSLWKLFENKSKKESSRRLQTVVSTMAGKFGKTGTNTEVPRRTLIAELEKESDFFSTQELKSKLCKTLVIPFGKSRT